MVTSGDRGVARLSPCDTSAVPTRWPLLILNGLGAIWLVLGALSAAFQWRWAGNLSLVANWMGLFDVAKILAGANLALAALLGLYRVVRRPA